MCQMSKLLNIDLNPPVQTFNNMAIPLGVLASENLSISRLYAYRFCIPIFYYREIVLFDGPPFRQWDCFECVELDSEEIFKHGSFVDLVIKSLNQEQYVYVPVNEKYIPQRKCFEKEDFNHDLLIYGYSDENKEFTTCACNAYGQYRKQILPFDVVEQAFNQLDFDGADDIVLFNVRHPLENSEALLLNEAINVLKQYMHCESTFKFPGHYYGMDVYNALEKLLKEEISKNLDMRNFRLLYEQKQVIYELLGRVYDESAATDYKPVVDCMKMLFNLAIKYNLKPSMESKQHIFQYLGNCYHIELEVLNKWID